MAVGNAATAVLVEKEVSTTKQLKTFLSRYFYLCMSLVTATLAV